MPELDTPPEADLDLVALVEPAVAAAGCELWSVVMTGIPGNRQLRVYIDADGGVDIERCTRVAQAMRPVLDAPGLEDISLEVSSPGAERRLHGAHDYLRYIGRRVNVRFRSGDSETVIEGPLVEVAEASLSVEARGGLRVEVPLHDVIEARGAVDFGRPREARRP
jgi:ribosome maturation factor RimP